jgi:hypothetical protein
MAIGTDLPQATPVLTVHANYVSGDYVGTSGTAMEFQGCANIAGGGGWIVGAELIDYALQSVAMELWLFSSAVTPPADSAAWTISDADALKLVAVIPFNAGDYYASALNSVCDGAPLNGSKRYICESTSLYGCLVTRGAPTFASGDLTVKLSLMGR